ncbi:hypothetical protein D3C74_433680 [compost metagenome]
MNVSERYRLRNVPSCISSVLMQMLKMIASGSTTLSEWALARFMMQMSPLLM